MNSSWFLLKLVVSTFVFASVDMPLNLLLSTTKSFNPIH